MLYITYSLNALLMLLLPLLLGFFLAKKFGVKWSLFGIGAVTFIASQVVHLPLLWGLTALFTQGVLPTVPPAYQLIFNAVVLGLAAGVCESVARYLVLRFWLKSARTWREALMFGAGHGGVEAMLLGALVATSFLSMLAMQSVDVATLPLSAEQQAATVKQIAAYWSAPWYTTLLGAVERAFALCFHLSAAVMVLQVFTRKNLLWLGAAILWHALGDGATVFASGTIGPYWTEAIVGVWALGSLGIIFALRPRQAEPAVEAAPSVVVTGAPPSPRSIDSAQAELQQDIDQSKYAG